MPHRVPVRGIVETEEDGRNCLVHLRLRLANAKPPLVTVTPPRTCSTFTITDQETPTP